MAPNPKPLLARDAEGQGEAISGLKAAPDLYQPWLPSWSIECKRVLGGPLYL